VLRFASSSDIIDGSNHPLSEQSAYPAPREGVPWDTLGFGLSTKNSKMVVMQCKAGARWGGVHVQPYGPLSLEPAATILNYGQGIFEGMKAFRTEKERIMMFRPHKNAHRFKDGAERMMLHSVPIELFIEACSTAVRENGDLVPPVGKGALYLRPMLFGSGADLGVRPSTEFTFVIFVSPVGQYFGPGSVGARMRICTESHRAAPGGVGHVKCVGNYSQCFLAQKLAKEDGFSDVVYTDVSGEHIEEAAASNFFCVDANKVVHTPQLGSILNGVTRDAILTLTQSLRRDGVKLKVGQISLDTVMNAKEAFVTGTGASVIPIEHISNGEEGVNFACPGAITSTLKQMLLDVQCEATEDRHRWLHDPFVDRSVRIDSFIEPSF